MAKLPTIAAYAYKKSIGQPFLYPNNSLDLIENFLTMMFAVPSERYEVSHTVVNALKKLLMDNHYLLSAIVSGSQEQPDRLIRATTSLPQLQGLTTADLNEAARKYLRYEDALPVVIAPSQTTGKAPPARPAERESALAPAH
jgi:hypothetical protein